MNNPEGARRSPFSSARLADRLRFEDVQWADGETLVWLEGRPDRNALVLQRDDELPHDLEPEISVHAGVGYGGGGFGVSRQGLVFVLRSGTVVFHSWKQERARALHPAFGAAASPMLSPDGKRVLFIHSSEGLDLLASADASGTGKTVCLSRGADFYMQPVWHPQGKSLSWVEWDHPQMPWNGSRLQMADFDAKRGELQHVRTVAGREDIPVFQPTFSPDGHFLAWIEGDGEEDALKLLDLESGEQRTLFREIGFLPPAWVQGLRAFAWNPDSRSLSLIRNRLGIQSPVRIGLDGSTEEIPSGPYTAFSQIAVSENGTIAAIASAPSIPDRIVRLDGSGWVTIRESDAPQPGDAEFHAEPVSWTAGDGTTVHGLYYAPAGSASAPPLIVNIHGGPTSQRQVGWNPDANFFTSRGWAVLEVNYRGSTGYGRSYQNLLEGAWGVSDVEDAAAGALAMASQRKCNPKRMVIKGGSSGGFTVLSALIAHPGLFRAGICLYGVSDLEALAAGTHKFEAHYTDRLVAPLPEGRELYRERSPLTHADALRDPIALFQGAEDRVVPPDQSARIGAALTKNGIPHIYRLYPGEGHGWRLSTTITAYYREVEAFLQEHAPAS